MDKIIRADFYRRIAGKNLGLVIAEWTSKTKALNVFSSSDLSKAEPRNFGVVTIRSSGYFRTFPNGDKSYASIESGQEVYVNGQFFMVITPEKDSDNCNAIIYKMTEGCE